MPTHSTTIRAILCSALDICSLFKGFIRACTSCTKELILAQRALAHKNKCTCVHMCANLRTCALSPPPRPLPLLVRPQDMISRCHVRGSGYTLSAHGERL
jgi:hypothetical protein